MTPLQKASLGIIILLLMTMAAYSTWKLKEKICQISNLEKSVTELKDSLKKQNSYIQRLEDQIYDESLFKLSGNPEALDYLNDQYGEKKDYASFISDKLMETNLSEGDNPLVPFAGMQGQMKINNIRILNHKWIIASFTDGKYWGEILLEYEPVSPDSIHFHTLKAFIYPP